MNLRMFVMCALALVPAVAWAAPGDTLVGDPFVNGYNGWFDPNGGVNPNQSPKLAADTVAKANWGISLVTGAMQENSDGWFGEGAQTTAADGQFTPYLLVKDNYTTPSSYTYSATITSFDDDGFGMVFGYQDPGNYYRVSLRAQPPATNSRGFGQGVSVQKVSTSPAGVVSISKLGESTAFVPPISADLAGSAPMNVKVKVDGTNWEVYAGEASNPNPSLILNGTDSGLAAGKIGLQSWYERGSIKWGMETSRVEVSDASGTLFQDTFASSLPVQWRSVVMKDAAGVAATGIVASGSFRQNFVTGTISDDSNGYTWATAAAKNTDFLGPAIVVDEAGSTSLTNYEMKVRLASVDDDGLGVLVRALDDKNFYRINFAAQAGDATQRAPQGMSIQKCQDGAWSMLYRDDLEKPDGLWTYTPGADKPFDLIVRAVDNQLYVEVIDPAGGGRVYPIITDSNPILAGSVGLTTWGDGGGLNNGAFFSRYGGKVGDPLLIEASVIPEPASCLLACGFLGLALLRRRW
ncbi:MAG: hypothetical protein KA354_03980 [Phycisphaerae bacterium]|nr:hypothetical protein [Phycisphaerae bacterium]